MKNVILIRHAKSSWDSPSTDKHRPLSNRGVEDARLVSSHIAEFLPKKSIIWSSTAKRAKDTATIFLQNMTYPIESIIFRKELYTFDVNELTKIIKTCNNSYVKCYALTNIPQKRQSKNLFFFAQPFSANAH